MGLWDTREGALGRLRWAREKAKDYQEAMAGDITAMSVHASAAEWAEAFIDCSYALQNCRWALSYLYHVKSADPLEFGDTFFLETYTIAEAAEFDLTWDKICGAWIDAPKAGRLTTVLTLDELRRSVWDYEFNYFKIAEPTA